MALSKQACPKSCAREIWNFDEVADHLDAIELRSWIMEDGEWSLYQEGRLAAIRPLTELMAGAGVNSLGPGGAAAMLGGTFGVISGGIRPASRFRMQMHDPILGRTIDHGYFVRELPLVR